MEEKKQAQEALQRWNFGLISEVVERVWIVWVLKRMREAMEEKVLISLPWLTTLADG
jgi:replication fork protection complex subunit Tof1/Swi1